MVKKHCDLCDKDISYAGWSQHLKSKKHQRNAKEQKESNQDNTELLRQKDKIINDQRIEIKLLKEQLEKAINKTTTTINNTQIVNQLTINNFGQEDFTAIMDTETFEEMKELKGLPLAKKMIKSMYNTAPNNTVQIPNMNQPFCMVKHDNKWQKEYLPPVIQVIKERLPEHISKIFGDFMKKTNEGKNYFIKKANRIDADKIVKELTELCKNKNQEKEILNIIKATLYNN